MNYEYTYLWWEGSTTSPARSEPTTPPIGEEVIDKINRLAAEGWELDQITAAPLTTGLDESRRPPLCNRTHRQGPLLSDAQTTQSSGIASPILRLLADGIGKSTVLLLALLDNGHPGSRTTLSGP
jgi:hypothetical protein